MVNLTVDSRVMLNLFVHLYEISTPFRGYLRAVENLDSGRSENF